MNFTKEAFPHMSFRSGTLEGVAARIARVSFTGEVSYEINVAASYAEALWERLLEAGAEDGIAPYGLEALIILRLEKGYRYTDGNFDDIGWGCPARKSGGSVRRRSTVFQSDHRQQLVGFKLLNNKASILSKWAHIQSSGRYASGSVPQVLSLRRVTNGCRPWPSPWRSG